MTTLANYKERIRLKGIPAEGDASKQLAYCVNYARRVVWRAYEWPFKRVISSNFSMTSSTPLFTITTIDSTLSRIDVLVNVTNDSLIIKKPFDSLLLVDPALDDTATSPTYFCDYNGTQIRIWPGISGSAVTAKAIGIKSLTELTADTDTESDMTSDDLVDIIVMIAYARALAENDDITKLVEGKEALAYMRKYITDYATSGKFLTMSTPGWNPVSGIIRSGQ